MAQLSLSVSGDICGVSGVEGEERVGSGVGMGVSLGNESLFEFIL